MIEVIETGQTAAAMPRFAADVRTTIRGKHP
jgi:hypothetical protein